MRRHVHLHIEISSDTAFHRLALLRETNHLAVVYTSRNGDLNFLFLASHTAAFASLALLLRDPAAALADRAGTNAGELSKERVARLMHATAARAGSAGLEIGTALRAVPSAHFTDRDLRDEHFARGAKHRILK